MLPPISVLNGLDEAGFARTLGPLFEGAPRFLSRLARARPFEGYEQLLDRGQSIAFEMPGHEQLELINCHPRIGAAPASVSAISYGEQGYDQDPGTAELQARLDELNAAYERRFGFRFVIFVAGRPRAEIGELMEQHLGADREAERRRALRDVFAISRARLSRLGVG